MASDNLRRFLHLERARPDRLEAEPLAEAEAEVRAGTETRIAGVERPQPAAVGLPPRPATGAQLDRFGPEPEPRLELQEVDGRRPFVRCCRCGADSNFMATSCSSCGSSLDTPEQHDFDERFWRERQAEEQRESRAEAERAELRARAEAEEVRDRRAMGEALAREVGESERRRLDGWWTREPAGHAWSPLGLRLLQRLLPERWHTPVLALSAGLAAVAAAYGVHVRSTLLVLVGAVALALLLLDPPG